MALEDINPDRGLVQKPLPKQGPLISMCKTVPGIYFDANGVRVDDELAASAGFDVRALRAEKAKKEAKQKAMDKIDAEFAAKAAEIDAMTDADMEEAGIVEPGSLVPTDAEVLEPHDKTPFVTKTSGGEPRVARVVLGGPVKEMRYDPTAQGWELVNRDTGKILKKKLSKDEANKLLLAEE